MIHPLGDRAMDALKAQTKPLRVDRERDDCDHGSRCLPVSGRFAHFDDPDLYLYPKGDTLMSNHPSMLLAVLSPYLSGYRDSRTGIAWIEDHASGRGHSLHTSIARSGSVKGMKQLGYWNLNDRTVPSHGWIYNIDQYVPETDPLIQQWLLDHCQCGGLHQFS